MKPFLDAGFFLTLLFEASGSRVAWQTTRRCRGTLFLSHFHCFFAENRLRREIESDDATQAQRAVAAAALQRMRGYLDEQVFQPQPLDYNIALHLAGQWQRQLHGPLPPALLLLWPALAATSGATHFLSFDARPRRLAQSAGLIVWPERL